MYNPIRAGTRGGAAEFKWSDVKEDKDREQYLGHSLLAPKGRWQNNKDITWYNKDNKSEADERAAEIRKIKEQEEDALSIALGFTPTPRAPSGPSSHPSGSGSGSGSNAINTNDSVLQLAAEKVSRKLEKEERKKDRAGRREERREKERSKGGDEGEGKRGHHSSRSSKRHGSEEFEKDLMRGKRDEGESSNRRRDHGGGSRRREEGTEDSRRGGGGRGGGDRRERDFRNRSRSRSPVRTSSSSRR